MKYMGSKNRIAKHILPIMLKDRKVEQWWVEPFVGGGNMIDKVEGNRLGSDVNLHVIEALKLIRDSVDIIPKNKKEFGENDYKNIKNDKCNSLYGYVGFSLSYGGKWFGGWRRDSEGKRDYVFEAYKNAIKQSPKLGDVILEQCSYDELILPDDSIIYCDPPYANATKYKCDFDHDNFWSWCRLKVLEGHKVFISEYDAPDDFIAIWRKEIVSSLTRDTGSKRGVEKLFVHKSQLD